MAATATAQSVSARPPFAGMVKEAAVFALVALALAVPLVGFNILDKGAGSELQTRFPQMFYGIGVLFVGKLAMSLIDAGHARPIAAVSGALALAWLAAALIGATGTQYQALAWLTWLVALSVAVRGWVV
ncbi:MAG: hypothetical protein ACT4N4_15520, partial [Rhodospirillales bacterium]